MKPFPPIATLLTRPLAATLLGAMLVTLVAFLLGSDVETGSGLDILYALRGNRPTPAKVVIVTLDSVSARALDLPERPDRWPRSLHARLVHDLALRGARVIGFDLLFEVPRNPADDQALAEALRHAGNVVLATAVHREPLRAADGSLMANLDRLIQPMPLLHQAAWASAPFIMPKTADGALEFWTTLPMIGDQPSLPLLMAQRMGSQPSDPGSTERRRLNLYGPLGSVQTIHYSDALRLAADPVAGAATFAGKAVLVGYSESNQSRQIDAFHTPYSTADGTDVSGVELCATALANLLDNSELHRPSGAITLGLLLAWSALLVLPWRLPRTNWALACTFFLCLAYGLTAYWAFSRLYWWLPVLLPLGLAPAFTVPMGLLLHQKAARRREQQLARAVDLGLTRSGMEKLAAILPGHSEGETLFAVCLCSDIESYTGLSESLAPAAARDTLNRYFSRFIPIVEQHGGYVMDIVGDSVMCIWIADGVATEACRQAQAATLALHRAMNVSRDSGALPTRFGLHYGPVFVGPVGAHRHSEFRAVGDIVNTSSRIQGANKQLGCQIMASGEVVAGAPSFPSRHLGRFALMGKSRPVELFQLMPEPLPNATAKEFELGRAAFQNGENQAATAHFQASLTLNPADGPSLYYLKLCNSAKMRDANPSGSRDYIELESK